MNSPLTQSKVLWVDFLANGIRLADENKQKKLMKNATEAGITHIVIDAKIPYGHVTYQSDYGIHVSDGLEQKYAVWKNRDFLSELKTVAKEYGLLTFANINIFSEGLNRMSEGKAFSNPEWKVQFYNSRLSKESSAMEYADGETVFVNPIHPEVVQHELTIIKEVTHYGLDGIILDRCRYPNVYGDFSDLSRGQFEDYIGEKVNDWPKDIFTLDIDNEVKFGKYFPLWTEWRALNIRNFIEQARDVVKGKGLTFGNYTGSWYPLYYSEGVNWGSETYNPTLEWTSETYNKSGHVELLDFLMTGCYYPEVTKVEAEENNRPADWYSVEGAIDLSLEVVNNQAPYIGSLFLKDYDGHPEQFKRAIRMCLEKTDGVMLFDTVYLDEYKWWDVLKDELNKDISPN